MEIPEAQPKRRLITKILMLISGILTIRILLISIRILLASIVMCFFKSDLAVVALSVNNQPLVLPFSK